MAGLRFTCGRISESFFIKVHYPGPSELDPLVVRKLHRLFLERRPIEFLTCVAGQLTGDEDVLAELRRILERFEILRVGDKIYTSQGGHAFYLYVQRIRKGQKELVSVGGLLPEDESEGR